MHNGLQQSVRAHIRRQEVIRLGDGKCDEQLQLPILTISSNLAIVAKLGDPNCL